MDDLTYARNFGFAISIDPVADGRHDLAQLTPDADDEWGPGPNGDYLSSLDAAARTAYLEALSTGPDSCRQQGYDKIRPGDLTTVAAPTPADNMAIVEAIPDEFLLDEPEAQRGLTAWSNCMRAEGFDYPTPGDAFNDVAERFAALPERQDYRAEPMTDELRKIVLSEEGPKGLLDPAELAEFQQEEIAIAVAERSCYEAALEPELRRLADRLADEGPSASLEAKLREAGLFAEG